MPRPRFFQLNSVGQYHRPSRLTLCIPKGQLRKYHFIEHWNFEQEPYTILYRKSVQRCNFERLQLSGMKLWIFEPQFQSLSVSDCHSLFQQVDQSVNKNHIYGAMWEFEHQWHEHIFTTCTCVLSFFWGGGLRIFPQRLFLLRHRGNDPCVVFPADLKAVLMPSFLAKLRNLCKLQNCESQYLGIMLHINNRVWRNKLHKMLLLIEHISPFSDVFMGLLTHICSKCFRMFMYRL